MIKVLAFLLTAILAVTAFTVAAETPSPEKSTGVIVSVTGKDADGNALKLAVEPTKIEQSAYTSALDNLKKETGDDNLKIVDQKQLVLKEGKDPKFPLTVELKVPGVKPTSKVYVLFKAFENQAEGLSDKAADGEVIGLSAATSFKLINLAEATGGVEKLDAKADTDKVTVTFNTLGEFVLVTDAQTVVDIASAVAENAPTSDKTADKATPVMVVLFAVVAVATVISAKKLRTAA